MAKDNFVLINARITFKNIPLHKLTHYTFKDVSLARESFMKIKGVSECVIVQTASSEGTTNLSFSLDDKDLKPCLDELIKSKVSDRKNIQTQSSLGKVSIVGTGIQNQPGYASRMFKVLANQNINIEMITTSEIRITCIIKESDLEAAAQSLHKEFID